MSFNRSQSMDKENKKDMDKDEREKPEKSSKEKEGATADYSVKESKVSFLSLSACFCFVLLSMVSCISE